MSGVRPCLTCPWRVGSDPGRIPRFDLGKAERLVSTAIPDDGSDGWFDVMACHHSTEDDNQPCVGSVAADQDMANINHRLLAVKGEIDPTAIREACADLDLYPTFALMLASLRGQ